MNSTQVLIVGTNPNLMFYGWRLQHTGCVEVSVVNGKVDRQQPVWFHSESLGNQQYQPSEMFEEISQIEAGREFDIVIISAQSLQHFQSICDDLGPFVMDNSIILIESTGYVNLEPFIQITAPKGSDLTICSIMNESDVRETSQNGYVHFLRNGDNRIYFGTCSDADDISSHPNFQKVYKLLQIIQENSDGAISLLKSTIPREFMTYQWKLALPRIIFNPLSIIFEAEFPEQLDSQILCKPLISGVLHEIFKIIKKMDCKLVKGYENEKSLMENWSAYFPITSRNEDFVNSPLLFYKFYHQEEMEIDLLLLQPILLADDHGIRTPYLENLYSTMCQFLRLNDRNGKSVFFKRADGSSEENSKLTAEYEYMSNKLNDISSNFAQIQTEKQSLESRIKEKEFFNVELDNQILKNQQKLDSLNAEVENAHIQLEFEKSRQERAMMDHEQKMYEMKEAIMQQQKPDTPTSAPTTNDDRDVENSKPAMVQKSMPKPNPRESIQVNDNFEDLADIALYGATLNGESTGPQEVNQQLASNMSKKAVISNDRPEHNVASQQSMAKPRSHMYTNNAQGNGQVVPDDLTQHLHQKELELQRREQALLNREFHANQDPNLANYRPDPSQMYGGGQVLPNQRPFNYNQPNATQYSLNGYNQGAQYYHGEPAPVHGYPPNGMQQGAMPPNMRNQRYQSSNPNSRSRVSSVPSMDVYQEGSMHPQYGYGQGYQAGAQTGPLAPPMQPSYGYGHNQHHTNSFSNAAPIDPMVEQRFRAHPKKSNRRSAFPQMSGNLEGLDMGGRGGMPVPGAQPKSANGRSRSEPMNQTTSASRKQANGSSAPMQGPGLPPQGDHSHPHANQAHPHANHGHPQANNAPSQASSQGQFLQRPNQMPPHSSNSSGNSVNTEESRKSPATDGENGFTGVQLSVPQMEPKSAVSNDTKAGGNVPKKKGLFRKK